MKCLFAILYINTLESTFYWSKLTEDVLCFSLMASKRII